MTEPRDQTRDDTDRWADALAGREPPTDRPTREAASIRAVVERRLERDLAGAPADAQRLARLEKRLADAGLLNAPAAPAVRPSASVRSATTWLDKLRAWVWPDGGGPMRLGLAAAALAAVVALPMLRDTGEPDESLRLRSAPRLPAGEAPAPPAGQALRILSIDPAADARRLQATLASLGVTASVQVGAADALVSAAVPPERRDAVARALSAQGLQVPDGPLQIRFVRQP